MRLVCFLLDGRIHYGIRESELVHAIDADETGQILSRLSSGESLNKNRTFAIKDVELQAPVLAPGKIICIGLNYADHAKEGGHQIPTYPLVFLRVGTSVVGPNTSIVRPLSSSMFDYEGELAVVIGRRGRKIPEAEALDYVAGYSCFNDGSLRDYQRKTSQMTMGKNFDRTGSFGPELVTADELPMGAHGLRVITRLNGAVMQDGNTNDMIFSVAKLIEIVSEVMTLDPGDVIITGTPAGVGAARKPPVWMKAGDVCEVEIEKIGILRNDVIDE